MTKQQPFPTTIRIGYRDYAVVSWESSEASASRRLAEVDRFNLVIRVREDIPASVKAECLIHEVLHAAWEMADIPDKADEERAITGLSLQLAQVIRDNPHLVAYLEWSLTPRA